MPEMEVTFTKGPGRRYFMTVVRERGIALAPRQGPGYHDYLPHDAVHFIVEREAGLTGGVFGRIAAGQSNIFPAADPRDQRRSGRREARRRPGPDERADMERSEALASVCLPVWERAAGHRSQMPPWMARVDPALLGSRLLDRILPRLDEFAERWHALPSGGKLTLAWTPAARESRVSPRTPAAGESRVSPRTPASRRARPARTRARAVP